MKKSIILIGIFSPLYYFIVSNMMLYMEYSEKYAFIQNLMLFILPALPGVIIAFGLVRNSLKEYFISLGSCFLFSVIIFVLYEFSSIDLMIHKFITGYGEFSKGAGLLFVITFLSYILSCFIGALFSGIISLIKQNKNRKNDIWEKQSPCSLALNNWKSLDFFYSLKYSTA